MLVFCLAAQTRPCAAHSAWSRFCHASCRRSREGGNAVRPAPAEPALPGPRFEEVAAERTGAHHLTFCAGDSHHPEALRQLGPSTYICAQVLMNVR